MEYDLDIGPAVLRLHAVSAAQQTEMDSEHVTHQTTDHDDAIALMYPPEKEYSTRLRVDFKPNASKAERKAIADIVVASLPNHIPPRQMTYEGSAEERVKDGFDVSSSGLLSETQSTTLLNNVVAAALEARDQWWKTNEGQAYADPSLQQLKHILDQNLPKLTPVERVQAEQTIIAKIPAAKNQLRGVKQENLGAGLAFHLSNDKHMMSELGSVGINANLAKQIFTQLGEVTLKA